MKKIKINSVLSNTENETTNNKVIIERSNDEYHLKLEFKQNETIKCKCNIKTVGLDMELEVYTKELNIDDNIIYIEYTLSNENNLIGSFEYKLMLREWYYGF